MVPATPEPAPDAVASDTDDPVAEQSDAERARPLDPPAGNVIPRFVEPERAEGPEAGNADPAPIDIDPAAIVDATPDDGETTTPTPETAPPAEPTEPAAEPTEEATVTEITVVAQDTAFDTGELTFEAGATVRLTLENRDPIPHNLAIYRTDAAEDEVFVGETFTGPDASRTYEFTAPAEPGEYFFRCDTHPTLMTGTLIVE